jgi:hypothetical protein
MDKAGYTQPFSQDFQEPLKKADLEKWSTANRDIWKLVRITGATLAQAKDIVIGRWDLAEKTRFEAWVNFFESEDDKKYRAASYIDCDTETVRGTAIKLASGIGGLRGESFLYRIAAANNAKTIIDYIRAMSSADYITKTAAEDEDSRSTKMFNIIREVQDELSKKKLVRNLARVLSMDRDGMFPEVPQALAKLIESYGYATTRIQDVMGRLGLQLSMTHKESEPEEDKLSKVVETPKEVRKETSVKAVEPEPVKLTPKSEEKSEERPTREESEEVMLPRVRNRGV